MYISIFFWLLVFFIGVHIIVTIRTATNKNPEILDYIFHVSFAYRRIRTLLVWN